MTSDYLLRCVALALSSALCIVTWPLSGHADAVEDMLKYERERGTNFGVEKLVSVARAGNGAAQAALGEALLRGDYGVVDPAAGIKWMKQAGENGYPLALSRLGDFYNFGQYIAKDVPEAIHWYEKAYEAGVASASIRLAHIYGAPPTEDFQRALSWYRKGAEGGLAYSQRLLGYYYSRGQGVPLDYAISLQWFLKAMEPKDYYVSSDDRSGPEAMIATYYDHGLGVERNDAEALRWYRLAAADGDAYAKYVIAGRYERGEGVPKDWAAALRRYQDAADHGYQPAQYRLGLAYERGEGVPRDRVQAVKWLTMVMDDCCLDRTEAYAEFEKAPLLFAATTDILDPETRQAAERALVSVKAGLSQAEIAEGEALADKFQRIPPNLPIP